MDVYRLCLYLGFTGLVAMAVLGASHIGGHSSHGHSGHGAHGSGHGNDVNLHGTGGAHGSHAGSGHSAHSNHSSHAGHGHSSHHSSRQHSGLFSRIDIFSLLSPRLWFSMLIGFGAMGVLLKHALPLEPWRFLVACCGGLGFEKLLMGPVWNVWTKFASQPARTLESAVAEEARAVTGFDADGHGLVSLDLDGQVLQVLARLSEAQRHEGVRVRMGDRLFVEDVDAARNRCTVSRLDN